MKGGDAKAAHAFLDALSLFGLGYSWGGFESLITYETPQMAFRVAPPELGGPCCACTSGLEDPAELIADLEVRPRRLACGAGLAADLGHHAR